jgi:hypothetical protein
MRSGSWPVRGRLVWNVLSTCPDVDNRAQNIAPHRSSMVGDEASGAPCSPRRQGRVTTDPERASSADGRRRSPVLERLCGPRQASWTRPLVHPPAGDRRQSAVGIRGRSSAPSPADARSEGQGPSRIPVARPACVVSVALRMGPGRLTFTGEVRPGGCDSDYAPSLFRRPRRSSRSAWVSSMNLPRACR